MKRYNAAIDEFTGYYPIVAMKEIENGDYVRYEDHVKELSDLRAISSELSIALKDLLSACDSGQRIQRGGVGGQTVEATLARTVINGIPCLALGPAYDALARAEQFNLETCVWSFQCTPTDDKGWYTSACGGASVDIGKYCLHCGKRIEVKQ